MVTALRRQGASLAVAESLTGGALSAALVAVPGVSAVLRGGVVAYATDVKSQMLDVDGDLLGAHGPVHPEVARQMAVGVAHRLGADHAVATTGVAGPGPADGAPAGTVWLAAHGPDGQQVRGLLLAGGREHVRQASVSVALALLGSMLSDERERGRRREQPADDERWNE